MATRPNRAKSAKPKRTKETWEHLSDEDLLKVRICDLKVRIEGSGLEPRIRQLYEELGEKGIYLRPRCYLSDEWLSPDGQAAIGIPFYLAHPRLKALEFRMMFEIEGGTQSWCMKLLRHEAGHAIDHAYGLSKREDWRRVFGSPRAPYNPYFYTPDPHSKKHTRNLPDDYGQCHPQEDFAETFAVWLNPRSLWRRRYAGWPAARKLHYVDRRMREIMGRPAPRRKLLLYPAAQNLRSTLKSYYARKFRLYQLGDLSFAAQDMRKIFRVSRAVEPQNLASALIRKYKRPLVESISSWSGEHRNHVSKLLAHLARLCDEHHLVVRDPVAPTLVRLSTYATTLIVTRLHTHAYRLRRQ